jgi:hypothetical protein
MRVKKNPDIGIKILRAAGEGKGVARVFFAARERK